MCGHTRLPKFLKGQTTTTTEPYILQNLPPVYEFRFKLKFLVTDMRTVVISTVKRTSYALDN